MWPTIHAGHDEIYEPIKDNTSWWLAKTDSGLYKKNLQFHDTAKPIWLLWSHERLDNNALKEAWGEKTEELYGEKIPMGVNFAPVKDGSLYKENENITLKALHIEAPK